MRFIKDIVDYINAHQLDLKHLTIVLPSERAKKYILSALYQQYKKPVLAPELLTIDQWIRLNSDRTIIDKTRLILKLFEVQLEEVTSEADESFDEFLSWGSILVSDYDEIDRYMLSSDQVFQNLADIKDLENWSFSNAELSKGQERFMEFWDRLPGYYRRLNEELDKEGVYYIGKAYRHVAENIDSVFQKDPKRHFVFAGFNALSQAELSIMKQLYVMGRGHILIDADEYYLNNTIHEGGRFLRKLMSHLQVKQLPVIQNSLQSASKQIQIIECAQHTGQVKCAASILSDMTIEEIDQTLVLLADESLIGPLLKNLPAKIGRANITLGMPLRNTSLKTWVDLLFSIQENKKRFSTESMYIHDIQKLWNHPFWNAILNEREKKQMEFLERDFIKNNTLFKRPDGLSIGAIPDKIVTAIATAWKHDWRVAMNQIRCLNTLIFEQLKPTDEFEIAIIQGFDRALVDFQNLVEEGLPSMSLNSFKHLFLQHWSSRSIAFQGDPLEGLQIMGLLETRLLDFKKIIVLGMNEGKMPPTNPIQTMIPMDLRKYFHLPLPRDKQGLFAHHFYRLLHECEDLWVTYTSASENVGSNEASRYLLQLELELSRLNHQCKIERMFYTIPDSGSEMIVKQSIEKSPAVLNRIEEFFTTPLSASAFNKYITCPLDFYYRYLLQLDEDKTIEEEVESATFGTFIHRVLESLFEPFCRHDKAGNKIVPQPSALTSRDIDGMLKNVEGCMQQEFLKHFNGDKKAFSQGKNLLSYRMALELTERILKQEKAFVAAQKEPVFIEYLEVEMEAEMEIELNGEPKKLVLKGFMDRIDSVGSKVRIIDYKSGKVNSKDVTLPEFDQSSDWLHVFGNTKHAVQLAMYCYLYRANMGKLPDETGIFSLVNIAKGLFPLQSNSHSVEEIMNVFPLFVQQLVEEIYDETIPFEHQVKGMKSFCLYCD